MSTMTRIFIFILFFGKAGAVVRASRIATEISQIVDQLLFCLYVSTRHEIQLVVFLQPYEVTVGIQRGSDIPEIERGCIL